MTMRLRLPLHSPVSAIRPRYAASRLIAKALAPLAIAGLSPACAATAEPASAEQGPQWHDVTPLAALGASDRIYGKEGAAFSLIVWLDPECPFCKSFGPTPAHVVDSSEGLVNLAVRLYPLPFHGSNATLGATSALCVADQVGPAGFYRFLAGWLALTGSNGRGIALHPSGHAPLTASPDNPVTALASAAGATDRAAFVACNRAPATEARLKTEMAAAEKAGVDGTPAIAIRDNRPGPGQGRTIMIEGAIEESYLIAAIRYLASPPPEAATKAPGAAVGAAPASP